MLQSDSTAAIIFAIMLVNFSGKKAFASAADLKTCLFLVWCLTTDTVSSVYSSQFACLGLTSDSKWGGGGGGLKIPFSH